MPTLAETKKAIWRNLLSIQNEVISLVTMPSKELWLVQENHATVKHDSSLTRRGIKAYSESRIELRNLQFLIKENAWKIKSVFVMRATCELKSLDVELPLKLPKLKKYPQKICGCGQHRRTILLEFGMKGALVTVRIFVFCDWWFSN